MLPKLGLWLEYHGISIDISKKNPSWRGVTWLPKLWLLERFLTDDCQRFFSTLGKTLVASSGSVSSRMGAFMVATGGAPEGFRTGEVWGLGGLYPLLHSQDLMHCWCWWIWKGISTLYDIRSLVKPCAVFAGTLATLARGGASGPWCGCPGNARFPREQHKDAAP